MHLLKVMLKVGKKKSMIVNALEQGLINYGLFL